MESGDIGEIGVETIGKLPTISIDSKKEIVDIPQEGIAIETTAIFNKDDQVKLEYGNKYAGVLYDNGESVSKALDFARSLKGNNPLGIASQINDWISGKSLTADHPGEIQKLRDPSSPTYEPELADWVENNIVVHTILWSKPTEQLNTQIHPKLSEVMAKTNNAGKFYGVCKHMAVLGTAMLQEAGVPAWIQAGVHNLTGEQALHAWIVFLDENKQLVGLDPSSRTEDGKGILSTNYPDVFDNFAASVNSPKSSFNFDDSATLFSVEKNFENSALPRSVKALTEKSKLKLRIIPNKPFKGVLSGTIEGGGSYDPYSSTFPYKIISIDKVPENKPLEVKFGDNLVPSQKPHL